MTIETANIQVTEPSIIARTLSYLNDPRRRGKIIAGISILLIWQFSVMAFAPSFVAKPVNVILVFPKVMNDITFWISAQSTLWAVFQGLAIALLSGTIVGIAMGRVKVIDRLLNMYINGFYAMPMVAVLPLLTIWFGYDESARLATIIFAGFFSIAINARDGARSVPPEYLEVCKSYRAKSRHIWFDVTIFSSLPYLVAGFRLAAGRALVGAVIAEFFVAIDGLGMYILSNARSFKHNEAVVAVFALVLFGLAFESSVKWVLKHYMPWHRRDETKD